MKLVKKKKINFHLVLLCQILKFRIQFKRPTIKRSGDKTAPVPKHVTLKVCRNFK